MPSSNGTRTLLKSCAACSHWPFGTRGPSAWCWRATAWASSRCISAVRAGDRLRSELKALFELPEIERQIDLDGLNAYLSLNYVPAPYTLVSGIEKLLPGHWLEWRGDLPLGAPDARSVRTEAYWNLEMRPRAMRLEEAEERLDGLLDAAVREHMLSDVPLGIWLSGGLDSSTVLHYAAQASSTPLKTFSITFQGRSFDESSYVRRKRPLAMARNIAPST